MTIPLLGAGSAYPGTGAFTPNSLPDLKLWLRSTFGLYQNSNGTTPATANNDPVGFWQDMSPLGNNVFNGSAGQRPLLKTAIQNGLPVIRFDGVDDWLNKVTPIGITGPDITTFCVYRKNANVAFSMVFVVRRTIREIRHNNTPASTPQVLVNDGTGTISWSATTNTTSFFIDTFQCNRAGLTASIQMNNGTPVTASDSTLATSVPNTIDVGARNGALLLNGDIGEILFYNRTLSAGEITTVQTYLNAAWAIF